MVFLAMWASGPMVEDEDILVLLQDDVSVVLSDDVFQILVFWLAADRLWFTRPSLLFEGDILQLVICSVQMELLDLFNRQICNIITFI